MFRKLFFLFVVLLMVILPLSANVIGLRGTVEAGGAFAFPRAAYLETNGKMMPRTSGFYQMDLEFLEMAFGTADKHLDFAVGYSVGHTYCSLPFGYTLLREYTTKGPMLRCSFSLNEQFAVGFKTRFLEGTFPASKSIFTTMDYEFVPTYQVVDGTFYTISILAPLTLSTKADTMTLRFSLGTSLWFGVKETVL